MRLNLGCGTQVLDGWINVDYAVGARFSKIPFFRLLNKQLKIFDLDYSENIYLHDLTQQFPWSDCSIDILYSSHTLEHLSKEDGYRFLAECHRVLRKGGIIRIIVPDLQYYIVEYTEGRIQADEFVKELDVLYRRSNNKLKDRLAPFIQSPHKCMYDSSRLLAILKEIGFKASNRAPFDSDIGDIHLIELEKRTENAVIIEGRKY